MIVETTQRVASRRGNVLPLIRKMIRTHAYHSFGLLLKRFKIPLLSFRHYAWQVNRNRKVGRKWLQTLTHKKICTYSMHRFISYLMFTVY